MINKYISVDSQNMLPPRQAAEPDSQLYAITRYGKIYTMDASRSDAVEVSRKQFQEIFNLDSATLDKVIRSRGKHQLVSNEALAEKSATPSSAIDAAPKERVEQAKIVEDTGGVIVGELKLSAQEPLDLIELGSASLKTDLELRVEALEEALENTNEALSKLVVYVQTKLK